MNSFDSLKPVHSWYLSFQVGLSIQVLEKDKFDLKKLSDQENTNGLHLMIYRTQCI